MVWPILKSNFKFVRKDNDLFFYYKAKAPVFDNGGSLLRNYLLFSLQIVRLARYAQAALIPAAALITQQRQERE